MLIKWQIRERIQTVYTQKRNNSNSREKISTEGMVVVEDSDTLLCISPTPDLTVLVGLDFKPSWAYA